MQPASIGVPAGPLLPPNLAHLMPLSSVWAGPTRNTHFDGPPLLVAKTAGSTPFRLSTHVGDVGHMMVIGPTGAGKSVLLALIALQFRRYPQSQIYIFDKGLSARGNRLFELGLGPIALALCGASDPASQKRIDTVLAEHGPEQFASAFLDAPGLEWTADLIADFDRAAVQGDL